MKKTILVVLAMGALSCAVFSQQAQAAQITGTIRLVGGVHVDNNQLGLATRVVTWFDLQLNLGHSTVLTGDGDFSSIAPGTQADMFNGWVFNPSTPTAGVWSVGGFVFDLASATVVSQSNFFLNVRAQGTISGNGFDEAAGTFSFTIANSDGHPHVRFAFAAEFSVLPPATDFYPQNGKPDYVLYNGTHQTAVWHMNNNIFLFAVLGPTLPAGWNLIDVADFNSDGNPDYALFNPSTRQTAILYLSGVTLLGGALGPTIASGYQLTAVADFNQDGHPDYVLYNPSTNQTGIWYMNDNVFVSGAYGPTLPAGWSLAGVADFDGDGPLDYLLFKPSTRQSAIWYLAGTTFLSSASGPTLPNGWALTGTADFNSDGRPDYLLYNSSSRQTAILYMVNNVLTGAALGPSLQAGWNLAAP
jgi:FG-GAP-like repeat